MEQPVDYKPLERVTLPDIGDLKCSGLILVVGPNSSGKSQLLRDLYLRICGEPRALVVAENIQITKPGAYDSFTRWLESEGYFETLIDDNGTPQWRPRTVYLGTGQAISQIQTNQGQTWHNQYVPAADATTRRRSEFLNYFGRLFVTALFLDRRLTALNQVGVIDFENQPPQGDLHALYLDDTARERLFEELLDSFGKAVWPDTSRGNTLCVRVSDEGVLPSHADRLSVKKMKTFRTIESEGDGLKSYVAICVALLLGRRPVCLIDEPEMCLHPPQAYNLGRFIGKYGATTNTVTLAATHSSQILRGVIQTAKDLQIVRLTRHEDKFSAHLVPAEVLAEAVAKPTVRAESVLDGIFAQSVVVLESDGDRQVYQTVWETLASELRLDVHFATVGGIGGIADTCKLYRTLKIPVAVIADLDMITDPQRLRRVADAMGASQAAGDLEVRSRSIMEAIKKLPPTVEVEEVEKRLDALRSESTTWAEDGDLTLRRELVRLSQLLDRARRLKRGGVAAFPDGIAKPLGELLTLLNMHGIFLVPAGELEEWLDIQESKENKWAWANAAALHVQSRGSTIGPLWDFIRDVGRYLLKGNRVLSG